MTLTVDLTPDQQHELEVMATERGTDIGEVVKAIVADRLRSAHERNTPQDDWERRFLSIRDGLPSPKASLTDVELSRESIYEVRA